MKVVYHSTRDASLTCTASEAILNGIAPDGGLYVPDHIPKLTKSFNELCAMNYSQVVFEVLKLFYTDFTDAELRDCISRAYTEEKFDHEDITTLVEAGGAYYLELFHGSTIAFKDMALSIHPYLMTTAARKNNSSEEIVILTATSGDTGKAALAGFADVPGTRIIVFYPKNGVSPIQELQMVTQKGENTHVISIRGNFDDAQTEVKKMFGNKELGEKLHKNGYRFSSANSINIGRLIPQVAYYVYAYSRLCPEKINFVVPTGNFGNILSAHYAKQMGIPINKLICASNDNKVLYDFFKTGTYDRNREFILTDSPSMDILISSNLERLIYEIAGDETPKLMKQLQEEGSYTIISDMKEKLDCFWGGYATKAQMESAIKRLYTEDGYIIDPHTAVASAVYDQYIAQTGDKTCTVVVSTASPYKFTRSVMNAIRGEESGASSDFELIDELCRISGVKIPKTIEDIRTAPIRHNTVCDKDKLQQEVERLLNLGM